MTFKDATPAKTILETYADYVVRGGAGVVQVNIRGVSNPSPHRSWRPSQGFCRVAMVESPVSSSYLESTVLAAACEVAISAGSAGRACSTRRV
jgi:hypothetical protein